MDDPFADIRPYRDNEVSAVLARLLADPEFLDAMARQRLGAITRILPGLWRSLARRFLARQTAGVEDVRGVQLIIKRYMDQMIDSTTGGFTVSGLDQLESGRAYLFMSNHRDIAMDPAFTNYALHLAGFETLRIAIGDNLLTKPWVSDLMRLNKSFIVKRSASGPRELLAVSKTLSAFIRESIEQDNEPVWLAQREGRAKDGVDVTEPAVIKMLSLSRRRETESFSQHIAALRIVPVAISYELDPCDALKAHELHLLATTGHYEKGEQEDVASIARGITGYKGRVHVSFGTPLGEGLETPEQVAAAVDRQIIAGYCLHPTNLYAYRMLHGEAVPLPDELTMEPGVTRRAAFEARIETFPEAERPLALGIYANAVGSKLALLDGKLSSC